MSTKKIKSLREKINSIDSNLLELLSERRKLALEVIKAKDFDGKPIRDRTREKELLNRLVRIGKENGLDTHFVTKLFHDIIEDSIRTQQLYLHRLGAEMIDEKKPSALKIAIQGIEGSYSYLAANKFFSGRKIELSFFSKDRFEEVIQSVESEEADFAFLPVENTTSGAVNEVYDLLLETRLSIVGEEEFHVKHCLVSKEDIQIGSITKIYAHYQAAAQCSKFLASLPHVTLEYFADTAMSARKLYSEDMKGTAAISSEEAAHLFNLKIIRSGIANQPGNFTRFLAAARKGIDIDLRIPAKTSLIMATAHKAGSLVEALGIFKKFEVNMTKLQSRPILGNPWDEMFYLDFQGNIKEPKIIRLLDELGKHTRFFKILGCYPTKENDRTKIDNLLQQLEDAGNNETEGSARVSAPVKSGYKFVGRDYKPQDTIIKVKDVTIGGDVFTIFAGPHFVKSRQQILSCAREASENQIGILAGGSFTTDIPAEKFDGVSREALNNLNEAGESYGLPLMIEVNLPEHVKIAAKLCDIIKIGPSNMSNYSLLSEAGKIHRPILIYRDPVSSREEFLNSAEYLMSHGNRQIILCESGIRTFESTKRWTLDLSGIPVLRSITHLPIVIDPMNSVTEIDNILPLLKASVALGAAGAVVEFEAESEKRDEERAFTLNVSEFRNMMKEISNV
jgi:chorismate mutase/prephenate dehydratase